MKVVPIAGFILVESIPKAQLSSTSDVSVQVAYFVAMVTHCLLRSRSAAYLSIKTHSGNGRQ